MRRNPATFFAGLTLGALALAGCTPTDAETSEASASPSAESATTVSTGYAELSYESLEIDETAAVDASKAVDVTLADGGSTAVAGVSVDGDTVTITAAGTYRLSGTLTSGSVVVDVESGQVNLILDGVAITSDATAAINVVAADAVVVSLADGSTNTLSDAETKAPTEDASSEDADAPNAVLFSTADLSIEGSGSLAVEATVNDGITSKDSLVIEGGSITVDSVDDGVRGKDHIVVRDGTLTINAGGDGIKADNDEVLTDTTSTKGVAWFAGGSVDITAGDDGITAERQVTVAGGSVEITATDDGVHSEGVLSIADGSLDVKASYEGLEGAVVLVTGGDTSVVASDDGVNVAGGYLESATTATTDAGGATADQQAPAERPQGGPTGDGTRPDRGEMSADGDMGGGGMGGDTAATDPSELTVTTASGGGMGGMPGESNGDSGRYLEISGGTLTVDAQGDGLDANGTLSITGGTVTVAGPSSNGNAPVDADSYSVSGGELLAYGSSGMLVTPDADASQGTVIAVFSGGVAAGNVVTIADADGKEVASFTAVRTSSAVIYSSSSITTGDQYTITVAGVEVGAVAAA